MGSFTRDQVSEAACPAWWRRSQFLEPSFYFDGAAFHFVSPIGEYSPAAHYQVPESGWEHHTTCSCEFCGRSSRSAVHGERSASHET